jgi:hypothetical protein
MNVSSPGKYCKRFNDRYLQSREQQLLDLLNQRGAPVPELYLSDVKTGEVLMQDAGVCLRDWLKDPTVAASDIPIALAMAIKAVMQIANMGVWQWDLALRNLMIATGDDAPPGRVRMIDFGNAVAEACPLQKPLWMLPHADQHPLLRAALEADWRGFMQRQGLTQPTDLSSPFDLPITAWQKDWTRELAVEGLRCPWAILASGVGSTLREALRVRSWPGSDSIRAGLPDLFELNDDERAQSILAAMVHALETGAPRMDEGLTPQPRRVETKASAAQFLPMAATAGTGVVDVIAHQRLTLQSSSDRVGTQARWGGDAKTATLGMFSALAGLTYGGWWTLNQAWETLGVPISGFSLTIIVAGSAVTLAVVVLGLGLRPKIRYWYWGFLSHALAQILLGSELWLAGPRSAALALIVCPIPSLLGMVALWCLLRKIPKA